MDENVSYRAWNRERTSRRDSDTDSCSRCARRPPAALELTPADTVGVMTALTVATATSAASEAPAAEQ